MEIEEIRRMTSREWRIYVATKLEAFEKNFTNHLSYHRKVNYILATAACSSIGSLVIGIILLFAKRKIGG